MQNKHLRLVAHCHDPDHPKYLNVPLEFTVVDPGATMIEGGRLDYHLADDIAVTLRRTTGLVSAARAGGSTTIQPLPH